MTLPPGCARFLQDPGVAGRPTRDLQERMVRSRGAEMVGPVAPKSLSCLCFTKTQRRHLPTVSLGGMNAQAASANLQPCPGAHADQQRSHWRPSQLPVVLRQHRARPQQLPARPACPRDPHMHSLRADCQVRSRSRLTGTAHGFCPYPHRPRSTHAGARGGASDGADDWYGEVVQ